MGGIFSGSNTKPVKILVTGLDASGKTTMLYQFKPSEFKEEVRVIGLTTETARYKNLDFISWDSGGRSKIGPLKRHFHQDLDTAGVIYLVDATDRERIEETAEELRKELSYVEAGLRDAEEKKKERTSDHAVPLLIFANKMDLANAMTEDEIIDKLGLRSMKNRAWHVQPSCATTRMGLNDGLNWLTRQIERKGYVVTAACDLNTAQ